jgi:hypothetical protein
MIFHKDILAGKIEIMMIAVCKRIKLLLIIIVPGVSLCFTNSTAAEYYVDQTGGKDSNSGTKDYPWSSLNKVNTTIFRPGDIVRFKSGETWNGGLVLNHSGEQQKPITVTSYGTGLKPVFKNSDVHAGRAIEIMGDWYVLDNVCAEDAHLAGIFITSGADNNVVRNCDITRAGIGVAIHGMHNLVTKNYIHDLFLVVNTPGGHDDYGAVGIWIFNSNNEVSYNKLINCKSWSYDWEFDGGAVEFYGYQNIQNCRIHHNFAQDCNGFMEISCDITSRIISNNAVFYNISLNNQSFTSVHLTDWCGCNVQELKVDNNNIIENNDYNEIKSAVLSFAGSPGPTDYYLRNNIIYVNDFFRICYDYEPLNFTHHNNLYYFKNDYSVVGYNLTESEIIQDPLFMSLEHGDFSLHENSPAIDAGIELNYMEDYNGNPLPVGTGPDLGVIEFGTAPDISLLDTVEKHLLDCYPNPFSKGITISLPFSKSDNVSICIYNTSGQTIRILNQYAYSEVLKSIYWDGKDGSGNPVSDGIYFCSVLTSMNTKYRFDTGRIIKISQ